MKNQIKVGLKKWVGHFFRHKTIRFLTMSVKSQVNVIQFADFEIKAYSFISYTYRQSKTVVQVFQCKCILCSLLFKELYQGYKLIFALEYQTRGTTFNRSFCNFTQLGKTLFSKNVL